jgi:hypothetical protein
MNIVTNNVPRPVIDAWELTASEQEEFDYVNWPAIEAGEDSASFFRYKGQLYDLGEFTADYGITRGSGLPDEMKGWDGYMSESFFSAIVVKYVNEDGDWSVIVGTVYS